MSLGRRSSMDRGRVTPIPATFFSCHLPMNKFFAAPRNRVDCSRVVAVLLGCLLACASGRALDARYDRTLITLCDALVATQISDPASPDFGALVCPSTNPQIHPLHSRAAEAVYPFAVAYRRTKDPRYRDAAVHLAHWLIGKQQSRGAWGEAA